MRAPLSGGARSHSGSHGWSLMPNGAGLVLASARRKSDKVDAAMLAQLLRGDLLPEAWIPLAAVRRLRALLRHRVLLVRLWILLRNRIYVMLAGHGHDRRGGVLGGSRFRRSRDAYAAEGRCSGADGEHLKRPAGSPPGMSSSPAR
jgi:hypothetical protein